MEKILEGRDRPLKARRPALSPNRALALGFASIILAGALLLMLPAASRTGRGLSFLDSLFTAKIGRAHV